MGGQELGSACPAQPLPQFPHSAAHPRHREPAPEGPGLASAGMNGTANVNPAARSHFASAIPVPRAMAHGKPHTVPPPSTTAPPVSPRALSPQPAPGPRTLKPKGRAAEGTGGSPGVPRRGGQKVPARPLVPPGKWPEAGGSGRRGAGRAREPPELPKAPPAQGRAGGRLGAGPGKGSGVTVAGMGDEPHSGSQGRGPVFGSGAITFSSGAPHNHPVTATVAPFQYRLQERREEGDECPGPDPDPKPGGPSESRGVCWGWGGGSCRGGRGSCGAQTPAGMCWNGIRGGTPT
ncbi:uncharacterized protein ENSP00000471857-like isoform X1 [Pezoporus occidentalis]|uniref:uncharacterized protein ENSP00000471857-like isoform X1 n=2 Tax=Pezoporus occidentalis TaxID=407982 RepID=UPI002F91575F